MREWGLRYWRKSKLGRREWGEVERVWVTGRGLVRVALYSILGGLFVYVRSEALLFGTDGLKRVGVGGR